MLDARRRACLEAIGVELWTLREPLPPGAPGSTDPAAGAGSTVPGAAPQAGMPAVAGSPQSAAPDAVAGMAEGGTPASATPPAVAGARGTGPVPAAVDTAKRDGTPPTADDDAMPGWEDDEADAGDFDDYAAFAAGAGPTVADGVASLDWPELQARVAACTACELHATRTQTVFGVGDRNAALMVIGEAPGADEDRQGEPFVGRAGQLLNAMLEAIGLPREQVYIANIVKCRPPGNRDPHADEAAACRPYLMRQIELVQPRAILSVGRVSAHNLLDSEQSLARLRGTTHRFGARGIPLQVTYHPAYLLRRPREKAKAWQDLQAVHRLLEEPGG